MIVKAYKTKKIRLGDDLYKILDDSLPKLKEGTVVAVTSKIISICQGNIVPNDGKIDKEALVKQQADWYYEDENLKTFGTLIPTITNNILISNAGIDESNVEDGYLLWPKNLDQTTVAIWKYLRAKHKIKKLGVMVTDSRLTPLVYGITGVGISWCGFEAFQDYRGKPDVFGRKLTMSLKCVLSGLGAAAVVVTGEGNEQTPLATITDLPFVVFQNRPPTPEERQNILITKENDIFGKMLNSVKWEKGRRGK
jgi:putative folate metabolism gamma-glutamate ligase